MPIHMRYTRQHAIVGGVFGGPGALLDIGESTYLAAARAGDHDAFGSLAEPFRRELQVHCYRLLGSLQDAEDLVQETLLRAWQRLDSYAERASFRAWLYKIATNACLDVLRRRPQRQLPPMFGPPSEPHAPIAAPASDEIWIEPFPDTLLAGVTSDPAARYDAHESISLAFLIALQALPPLQRAVLLLRDVLDLSAREAATVLDVSVPALNSALHRARVTLAGRYHRPEEQSHVWPGDAGTQALLDRYVRAWETADVAALTALLKADVALSMPPSPSWYQGRSSVSAFVATALFTSTATGRWRLVPVQANSRRGYVFYERAEDGTYQALGVQVVTLEEGRVAAIDVFLIPALVPYFGLPGILSV